ncbi:MAG: hypothetical protein IT285_12375, partial [Bdellovibrionales bacterium]|nr:hypothetical protein [Bdellovibrionales bacterium]
MPALVKLGYGRRQGGVMGCMDGWSMYLQGVVLGGLPQDIHVIDVLTTQLLTALQIHLGDPADAGATAVTSKDFFTVEISDSQRFWSRYDSGQRWVAVQLGGPSGWAASEWSEFIGGIVGRHSNTSVVILGTDAERPLARSVLELLDSECRARVLSLAGETDFDLWASVMSLCQWLVSSERASIHLASVLGTRVLQLAHDPSRWAEWGPYGNGHYALSPAAGSREIPPRVAGAVWTYAHGEWAHQRAIPLAKHLERMGCAAEASTMQVHRTRIRPGEEGGGVVFEPLLPRSLGPSEWFARVMGHVARHWYCGWTPPVGQELVRAGFDQELVRHLRTLRESVQVMERV